MKTITLLAALLAFAVPPAPATPLLESTVTEIIKDVNILPVSGAGAAAAKLNDLVKAPDRVRTGPESRAELTAGDQTITRVGANTVFSFEGKGRVLNLEGGSVLFHSPAGKGGGTIKTAAATAAVLGTTIIVAATLDGGFKLIVLEGNARATLPGGKSIKLKAGQMVYVLPGGRGFSKVLDINLGKLVDGSLLVNGYANPLPSLAKIRAAVNKQNQDLAKGRARDTGIPADEFASKPRIGNGPNALDNNTYLTFGLPFVQRDLLSGAPGNDLPVLLRLQGEMANHYPFPNPQ